MRGAALAVSGLSQWGSNFLITCPFPILLGSIGLRGAYGLYAAFALISIFIVVAIVHETKGRTLEQMNRPGTREARAAGISATLTVSRKPGAMPRGPTFAPP